MGFNGFNPFKKHNKKEIIGAAGLAVAAAAGAALDAQQLTDGDRMGTAFREARKEQVQQMNQQELRDMQPKGPGGMTVAVNERGEAVVNMPPNKEDKKITSIDLKQPVTNVDLKTKVTDVDLRQPVYDMNLKTGEVHKEEK